MTALGTTTHRHPALAPVTRRAAIAAPVAASAAFCLAFAILVWTLEQSSVTEVGGGTWLVAVVGAIVSLPLFGLMSLIAAAVVGMAVALVDRRFSLRRLVVVTGCAIAAAVLATSLGAAALLRTEVDARAVLVAVGVVHLGVCVAYAIALRRVAGVHRTAAWLVAALAGVVTVFASGMGIVLG